MSSMLSSYVSFPQVARAYEGIAIGIIALVLGLIGGLLGILSK